MSQFLIEELKHQRNAAFDQAAMLSARVREYAAAYEALQTESNARAQTIEQRSAELVEANERIADLQRQLEASKGKRKKIASDAGAE